MREIDELYADSGEPVKESHGVSRGTALKVGGLGLAGALAAFMPGRAGAAVRKKASNASCAGTGSGFFFSAVTCGALPVLLVLPGILSTSVQNSSSRNSSTACSKP